MTSEITYPAMRIEVVLMSRIMDVYLMTFEGISHQRCFYCDTETEAEKMTSRSSGSLMTFVKQRWYSTEISCASAERGSAATETCPLLNFRIVLSDDFSYTQLSKTLLRRWAILAGNRPSISIQFLSLL